MSIAIDTRNNMCLWCGVVVLVYKLIHKCINKSKSK